VAPTAGNAWTLFVGKQASKGTAQVATGKKLRYTGGFGPTGVRNTIQLAESDALRQAGDAVVIGFSVAGTSEHYVRVDEQHTMNELLLGSNATTGTTNYTHTASSTASGSTSYATLVRALNSTTLVERMIDCQIASATFRGGAEQVLTVSYDWVGLTYEEGATDSVVAVVTSAPATYPQVTVTLGGVTTDIVDSFEITVSQARTLVLGDTGTSASQIVAGQYAVTGSMSILFESDALWREFMTGTTGGTTATTTIASKTLNILAQETVNRSIAWDMNGIYATALEVPGNTDGAPIRQNYTFSSARGSTLADVLEIITKNQTATT
jgi:hypothetical protein